MSYFAPPRPRIFGHRGAAGLAPENTLPSFALAVALGAEYLELDVHATRDGTIVVLHDPTLDRTTDGRGAVREKSAVEIAALDAGYWFTPGGGLFPYRGQGVRVPTLRDVLLEFPKRRFNIEVKQAEPSIVGAVIDVVEEAREVERVLLAAEKDPVMAAIRKIAGTRIATGSSAGEVAEFVRRFGADDWNGYRPPGQALQVPVSYAGVELVTAESVAAAHRVGCEVHVWTVNDRSEIARLLDLGVDGVMSDFPGLITAVVAERSRSGSSAADPGRR